MRNALTDIFVCFAAALIGNAIAASDALSQPYPSKPIRILNGYVAGGATDVIARLVAQKLTDSFGQPVLVEPRPGAGTVIAAERVATSPPDGYTLFMAAASTTVQSALQKKLPYDLERSFAYVSLVAVGPFVLVIHPSLPVRDVKELIALAQARPGVLNYGSPGAGTVNHLTGELFKLTAKVDMVHVAYKGSSESCVANAAGEIALSFPSIPAAMPLMDAKKLKALAVTGKSRSATLPSVPTLDEAALPGFNYAGMLGILAPAAVPKDILGRLNAQIVKAVNSADVKDAISRQGFEAQSSTPEDYASLVRSDLAKLRKIIEVTGLRAD